MALENLKFHKNGTMILNSTNSFLIHNTLIEIYDIPKNEILGKRTLIQVKLELKSLLMSLKALEIHF